MMIATLQQLVEKEMEVYLQCPGKTPVLWTRSHHSLARTLCPLQVSM